MSGRSTADQWPVKTVYFVDDASDEVFLAEHFFRRERVDAKLVHFVDFDSFRNALADLSAAALRTCIAIIDLNLTVSVGSQDIGGLREDSRYQHLIVGICSGSDDPADVQASHVAGADFFVPKPLDAVALRAIGEQVPNLVVGPTSEDGRFKLFRHDD